MQSIRTQLPRAAIRTPCSRSARPAYTRLLSPARDFSSTRPTFEQFHRKESFRSRLNSSLKKTKIKWEPIPIALGVGFLGAFQFYRIQRRDKHTQSEADDTEEVLDHQGRPKKRERIRPSGPWSADTTPVTAPQCLHVPGLSRSCLRCHSRLYRESGVASTSSPFLTISAFLASSFIPLSLGSSESPGPLTQ
jgi:hypothetical protein